MATNTMVRVVVPTDVADAARNRAESEGKTLADVVVDLLAGYAESKPKRTRKKT
ncbi:MAG: hypothetical protein ACRDP9_26885 [Kribbellaceae bacterium]